MKLTHALALIIASATAAGGAYSAGAFVSLSLAGAHTPTVTSTAQPAESSASERTGASTEEHTPEVVTDDTDPTAEQLAVPERAAEPTASVTPDEEGVGVGGDTTIVYPDTCVFVHDGTEVVLAPYSDLCSQQQLAAESIVTNDVEGVSFSVLIEASGDGTYSTTVNGFTVSDSGSVPESLLSTYDALSREVRS